MSEPRYVIIKCRNNGYRRFRRSWSRETLCQVLAFDGARPEPSAESAAAVVVSAEELDSIGARRDDMMSVHEVGEERERLAVAAQQADAVRADIDAAKSELLALLGDITDASRRLAAENAKAESAKQSAKAAQGRLKKAEIALAKLDQAQRKGG